MVFRRTLVNIHLYLSAFLAPAILMVAISGGGYLLGFKGSTTEEIVYTGSGSPVDIDSATLADDLRAVFKSRGIDYQFEYAKVSGRKIITRPTTKTYYQLKTRNNGHFEIKKITPDLQLSMIELHKGHGPTSFRNFQKIFAVGLFLIVVSGLWLGFSAKSLQLQSLISFIAGAVLFFFLAL